MNPNVKEAMQVIREAVAGQAALGNHREVHDIGVALAAMLEESRGAWRNARAVPSTPRSGEAIGHAFGDVPLCRGCSIEIGLGHPFCAECAMERYDAAVNALKPLT